MSLNGYPPFDLNIPKMGYYILVRNAGGWLGNRIEKMQRKAGFSREDSKYTHVEISGGGRDSMRIGPPRSKHIDITKHYACRYIKITKLKNKAYRKTKRYKIAYFAALMCNLKYDYRGVISFLIKWIKQNPDLPFCSEGSLEATQREIPAAFGAMDPADAMPAEFLNPEFVDVHWEGVIECGN